MIINPGDLPGFSHVQPYDTMLLLGVMELVLKGIPGSGGISVGSALLLSRNKLCVNTLHVDRAEVNQEMDKLSHALEHTREQLMFIRSTAAREMGECRARIFDAHVEIVSDPVFIKEIRAEISRECADAAFAVEKVVSGYVDCLSDSPDEYLRERATDIAHVGERIIHAMLGGETMRLESLDRDRIVVAEDISPLDIMLMDRTHVLGIAVAKGGPMSHAAIVARGLKIPAVFGLGDEIRKLQEGDLILVDGSDGKVLISPDPLLIEEVRQRKSAVKNQEDTGRLAATPHSAVTVDGREVKMYANIGSIDEIDGILTAGAEGVGLFRSEYLYGVEKLPDEEEQFAIYRKAAEELGERPLIIRTLDAGGDKKVPSLPHPPESDPYMGWRSIRISLGMKELFKTQLRAILRASAYGNVSVMFPMIQSVAEIREAKRILEEAKEELKSEGKVFHPGIRKGIMVEVPAAAVMADVLIREIDFFSIGTNDLCQFTLAVDRNNPWVSHLYQPLHPAVLRLVNGVVRAAANSGKEVGLCGEMASDPAAALVLLGMGLEHFSMHAAAISRVRKLICSVSMDNAGKLAQEVLQLSTAEEVAETVERALAESDGKVDTTKHTRV